MSSVIVLHSVQEFLPALRVPNVLYANVHALFNVAIADDLVHDDTHCMWGDIIYDSSPSVGDIGEL
jgi:hypothetical protein